MGEIVKNFAKGIKYYTQGTVTVSFPEDDVCCMHCPLMGMESRSNREYCRRTGEYLPAPRDIIGFKCPIKFEKPAE